MTYVSEPVGVDLTFGYDGSGNRVQEVDSLGGTVQTIYNADNELVTEIYTQTGGVGMQIQQDYNWQDQVTEERLYNSAAGSTLIATGDYGYNAEGSVTLLAETAIPIPPPLPSTIADYTMSYDAAQELTQQIDHGNTTNFAYDAVGELTAYGPTATQSYEHDGNRGGDTMTIGNEVTYDGTYSYAYDAEGNETAMWDGSVSWAYTYDNENHMTRPRRRRRLGVVMEANYK